MPNSPQIPFLANNSTVKAWCWTGTSTTRFLNPSQNFCDAVNFIDGYNLRLDKDSHLGVLATDTFVTAGALRFAFITPLPDTKYKVFLQYSIEGGSATAGYAHALNSSVYPKTTTGFWVRIGVATPTIIGNTNNNQMLSTTFGPDTLITNLRVVVL